jgi:GR25 family glycosyltransferase involved in LPS biosynthesis
MNPFDFFDKVYYINLDSRTDRREKMEEQFSKLGITAERFPAITLTEEQNNHLIKDGCLFRGDERPVHALYTKSCALSHLNVVLRAKLMQYKNVLILEDDAKFQDDVLEKLSVVLEDLKQQERWDMFYIGCNPLRYKKVTNVLGQSLGALAAHSYVINGHFYDKVLEMRFKSMPCIDMWYHDLAFNNNVYMSLENLAWQSAGYSNLEGHDVDYLPSIQARYENNMIDDNQ